MLITFGDVLVGYLLVENSQHKHSHLLVLLLFLLAVIKRTAGMRKPIFQSALRAVRLFNSSHTHTYTHSPTCTHSHTCMFAYIEALCRASAIKIQVCRQPGVTWHDTVPRPASLRLNSTQLRLPSAPPAPSYQVSSCAAVVI